MSFIELVDSIESSLGFLVQRFHELRSTRVTLVYELTRGEPAEADVAQGSLVDWRKDCSLARDHSLTRGTYYIQ